MRHFTARKSTPFALALTAMLFAQSVSAHEYPALNAAIQYAEVAATVANKVASQLSNFDAAVAKIDVMLQAAEVKRFDESAQNAEQCAENATCR
jgi:hypothetical protein